MNLQRWIPLGFQLSGWSNIVGVLVFSMGFTNTYMFEVYPAVMSPFGMFVIIIWGMVWLAMANHYMNVRALVGVFAFEKAAYVASWLYWLNTQGSELPTIWEKSPLTAIFYAVYGANDFTFCLFFAWVCWKVIPAQKIKSA